MMKKILGAAAALLFILPSVPAKENASFRIATVDLDRVFQEYYKTKIAEGNLKRQAELYKEHAARLEENARKVQTEFIQLRDESLSVVLTDAAREAKRLEAQEKYRLLMQIQKELKNFNQEKQAQLRDERDRTRAKIFQEIKDTAKKIAVLGNFKLVIDRSASSVTMLPFVIYSDSSIDLTEEILKNLNAGHREIKKNQNSGTAAASEKK